MHRHNAAARASASIYRNHQSQLTRRSDNVYIDGLRSDKIISSASPASIALEAAIAIYREQAFLEGPSKEVEPGENVNGSPMRRSGA